MSGFGDLADGFKSVFDFKRHTSGVKGFAPVDLQEENCMIRGRRDQYLSWDLLGINLWAREHDAPNKEPHIIHTVRFPKGSPGFITSVVYVSRYRVFLASALDMSFKIYSRELKLVEVIAHEERAVLAMEYDATKDLIIMAGANGVAVWRLWRTTKVSSEHIMEKLYAFEDLWGKWISGLQSDVALGDVYALSGSSVYVLSLLRREVKHKMKNIHIMHVTCVCWYGRSQFYMTGCMGGLIKCWTSFHYQKSKVCTKLSAENGIFDDMLGVQAKADATEHSALSLLHTFNLHTRAIAGLVLHPTSGMAISASMDGMIKVLNLEMFTEIYHINLHGHGIGRMIDFVLPAAPNSAGERVPGAPKGRGIMFTHPENNSIRLWRITSCAGFFGISSSDVISLRRYLNMHVPSTFVPKYINPNIDTSVPSFCDRSLSKEVVKAAVPPSNSSPSKVNPEELTRKKAYQRYLDKQKEVAARKAFDNHESSGIKKIMGAVVGAFADNVDSFKLNVAVLDKRVDEGALTEEEKPKTAAVSSEEQGTSSSTAPLAAAVIAPVVPLPPVLSNQPFQDNIYVASLAGRDLRLFTGKGRSITSVDPDVVVSGIVCFTVSVYQHMVYALMETGDITVYCTRTGSVAGEWSRHLRSMPDWARGSTNVEHEKVVCMSLVNVLPVSAKKSSSEQNTRYNKDLRGEAIPLDIEELIVLGCRSGCLIFLDTMNECRVAHVMQAHQLQVDQVNYRHVRQELFTLGKMSTEKGMSEEVSCTVIRVWSLPSLQCVCEVKGLGNVSPQDLYPNAFSISEYLPFFAVGCTDGDVRVFVVMPPPSVRKGTQRRLTSYGEDRNSKVEYGLGEGPADVGLPSAGSRSAAENFRIAPGTDVSLVGFGYMEAMLRSGDNHAAIVTAISFCDELQLYASASQDKVVKIWTCEKQIIRTIRYNMPTVCLLFNSATAIGDCIFTQFSYLLNIQRKLWDDGEALSSVREKHESWLDTGIGAGLFVADPDTTSPRAQMNREAETTKNVLSPRCTPSIEQSVYYTRRGGKYLLGSWDPKAPQYAEMMKNTVMQGRRQRTYTNNEARKREPPAKFSSKLPANEQLPDSALEYYDYDYENYVFEIDTLSPRMLQSSTPRDWMGMQIPSSKSEESNMRYNTASPTVQMKKAMPSHSPIQQKTAQRRVSNLGLGFRGAALLLAPESQSPEESNSSPDAAMYTATETLSVNNSDDDEENDVLTRRPSSPVLFPSAMIALANKLGEMNDDADPSHAHYSDKHHFDLIETERKAMQMQMHRQRHMRMGRNDKENEMLKKLGASGVVPHSYLLAKVAHRKSTKEKLNVLNLGVCSSSQGNASNLSSFAQGNNLRTQAISGDEQVFTPAPPAGGPPSHRRN